MPKILCLPGFATNKEIMNYQLRSFKKFFSTYEFTAIDPFYELNKEHFSRNPALSAMLKKQDKIFSWTPMNFEKPLFEAANISVDKLVDHINESGPYDIILGFSQGGRMLHYFLKNLEEGRVKLKVNPPKLYIFICGFMSFEIDENNSVLKTSNAKTIHLLGVKDDLFMPGLFMTIKYVSSFKEISQFMENSLKGKNEKKIRKNASRL